MSLNDPTTPTEPPESETPEAAPVAAPNVDLTNYVSREDYARLEGMLAQQGQMLQQIAGGQARAVPEPQRGPQYTDDQLSEMLESGEGRKILEAQRYIAAQQLSPLAHEFVQFRDNTMQTASSINRELAEARGRLPHAADPGVKRAMDDFLAQLPPGAQANPQAIELAHAHAVARPENFQRLIDQQVEAKLRQRAEGGTPTGTPTTGAPTGSRVPTSGGDTPTVSQLLGPEAAAAIRAQGHRSADEWVRKSQRGRFTTWAEYAKEIQKQEAQSGADDSAEDRFLQ